MSRIQKLNARLLSGGRMSFREFQTLLERYGWRLMRTAGSHHVYAHAKVPRPFPVVPNRADARDYQLQQFRVMIERYGLKMDDQ